MLPLFTACFFYPQNNSNSFETIFDMRIRTRRLSTSSGVTVVEHLHVRQLNDDCSSEQLSQLGGGDLPSLKSLSNPELSSAETENMRTICLDSNSWQPNWTGKGSHCETVVSSPINILREPSQEEMANTTASLAGSLFSFKNDSPKLSWEWEEEDFPGRCSRVEKTYIHWTPNENYLRESSLFGEMQDDGVETTLDSRLPRKLVFKTDDGSTKEDETQ